jgi:integrase
MKGAKNLVKIADSPFWYVRFQLRGQTIMESTKTTDLRQAIAVRNRIREGALKAAVADRLGDFIEAKRGPVEYSRLPAIALAYEEAAALRRLADVTVTGAVGSLRRVIEGAGHDWQTATAELLSAETVQRYVEARLRIGADDSACRSIKSTLTQARAVFSQWAMEIYGARFSIPDLAGFRGAGNLKVPVKVYDIPPEELLAKTKTAATGLTGEMRKVWLLAYGLALRAREVASVEWSWFRSRPAGMVLEIVRRDGWVPKGSERVLMVPANLWAELSAMKREGETTVLAGSPSARLAVVEREFAAWMRGLGWDREHCAHELRAWKGSIWLTELGAEVAREWLGHRNVATTCRYYGRLARQPKPIEEVL